MNQTAPTIRDEEIYYTDYPITELGDEEYKEAPVRGCQIKSFDGNKRCIITVEGVSTEIKACYIYKDKGRLGEVPHVTVEELLIKFPK